MSFDTLITARFSSRFNAVKFCTNYYFECSNCDENILSAGIKNKREKKFTIESGRSVEKYFLHDVKFLFLTM